MTEPTVSPTAIEVALAKALAKANGFASTPGPYYPFAKNLARALVDSGELVPKEQHQTVLDALAVAATVQLGGVELQAERDRLAAEVTHWKAKRNEAVSLYAARGEYLAEARAEVTRLKMVAGATPLEAFEVEHLLAEVERLSQALTAATAHAAEEADELDRLHAKNERLSQALREAVACLDAIEGDEYHRSLTSEALWWSNRTRRYREDFGVERAAEPVPPNMVSVEVPRTGRPNDRYWVRREPPAQEGERP